MAIVNSVKTLFPGFGNATEYVSLVGQNVPINATTTFTLTGFINYVRSGRIQLNFTAVPASAQVTGIEITGTDGTNTVIFEYSTASYPAATLIEKSYYFLSQFNITSISVLVTMANAGSAATLDLEIAGNP